MSTAQVTLPDGKIARVTFDTPEQLDATVNDLVKTHQQTASGYLDKIHSGDPLHAAGQRVSEAVGEPVLKAATGAAGAVAGGVAGVATGAVRGAEALASGQGFEKAREAFTDQATDTIQRTEEAFTRQPRTKVGQAADAAVSFPFTLIAKGANKAGELVAEKTGSPALGAATNTAIQAIPGAAGKLLGAGGRAETAAAPAEELTATGAPRTPPSAVGQPQARGAPTGPPEPPLTATGAPRAAPSNVGEGPPATETEARAREYASRHGLDWSRLGAGTRKALTTIAQDATALDKLNPAAVRRQAALQQLRVPVQATRGQLERDPVQLRREAIASNTSEGQPIRDIDLAANRDLQANLEVLRGRVGGQRGGLHEPVDAEGNPVPGSIRAPTKQPTQVGESLQGAARAKAMASKRNYNALYKKARETEPDAKVPVKPFADLLTENPEIQHLGWVQSWLSKAKSVLPKDPETGAAPELNEVTLKELHDLRSKANDIARTGGKEGYYAGQVVKGIDEAMKAAPEGAAAWKAANDAFRKHQQEFGDQGIVKQLVSQKKGGADRALALEKTWSKVATGPLDQIRQVKKTLLTGTDPALRAKGRAAWRDLRAETVNRILEDARNVTGADESERAILTETALRKSINRIPRENLEELIGKANTRELYAILRARRITTRSPVGGRTTQSGTVPNALVLAERGASAKAAKAATVSPLEQAARDVERAQASRARRAAIQTLEQGPSGAGAGAPPQPLPIGDAVRRPQP
jgi:hypothetical protein